MPDRYTTWLTQIQRDDRWQNVDGTSNLDWGPTPSFMYGSEQPMPFAPGEDIGIRPLPSIPMGYLPPQLVNRPGATILPGIGVSTVPWPAPGDWSGIPAAASAVPTGTTHSTGPWGPESTYRPGIPSPGVAGAVDYQQGLEDEPPPVFIPLTAAADPYESEEETMPTIWDTLSGFVDVIQGQPVSGVSQAIATGAPVAAGLVPPATTGSQYRVTPGGKVVPCKRRRRRRRLLTDTDFNDLVRIGTLPNKEGVKIALAKAVR